MVWELDYDESVDSADISSQSLQYQRPFPATTSDYELSISFVTYPSDLH